MLLLSQAPFWPFVVLLIGILAVIFLISIARIHAFLALMITAILVGLVSQDIPDIEGLSSAALANPLIKAVELPMMEFGNMAGKIAWVIALAALIGTAMMESGAADRIVQGLIKGLGEKQAALALLISGFVLSIPVFFDTVFFLLIPLARAFGLRTGKNYVLYVMAIAGGAAITHSIVPPTPGPLIMAETFNIDLGTTILAGIGLGILPAFLGLLYGRYINRKMPVPVRPIGVGVSNDESKGVSANLPALGLSILPVFLPIFLISLVSIWGLGGGDIPGWLAFIGNKNIAMLVGTVIAMWLWINQKKAGLKDLSAEIGSSLEIAGIIILITSAGGAFGAMIKHAGIGDAIKWATTDFHIHYILLAWIIAAVMKIAQGSSTVAMITTASIIVGLIGTGSDLPYHPIYLLMAIGGGALFISWMNDSGFWVVAKMSGFTEKEALRSWTVLLAILGVALLFEVLILSYIFPMV